MFLAPSRPPPFLKHFVRPPPPPPPRIVLSNIVVEVPIVFAENPHMLLGGELVDTQKLYFLFFFFVFLISITGLSEGRMQAYGWSLPARYSTEGANNTKGLVSVPVPIYTRPLNINEPGMKVCRSIIHKCIHYIIKFKYDTNFSEFEFALYCELVLQLSIISCNRTRNFLIAGESFNHLGYICTAIC